MFEHADQVGFRRWRFNPGFLAFPTPDGPGTGAPAGTEYTHRLGQVQGGKTRIDRIGQNGIGQTDHVAWQAMIFGAEEDAGFLPPRLDQVHAARGIDHRLFHPARTGRRGQHGAEISNRRLSRVKHLNRDAGLKGAGGQGGRRRVGPAIARRHKSHLGQAEIQHHPRGRADILTELRAVQDNNGSGLNHRRRGASADPARQLVALISLHFALAHRHGIDHSKQVFIGDHDL